MGGGKEKKRKSNILHIYRHPPHIQLKGITWKVADWKRKRPQSVLNQLSNNAEAGVSSGQRKEGKEGLREMEDVG
jgi:hypothetical protein